MLSRRDHSKPAVSGPDSALGEYDAKRMLARYGIPVVPERTAATVEETLEAARGLGFPVVVKGHGVSLMHKSDRGLVHLNLADEQAVREAVEAIRRSAADQLEGYLVQKQVSGRRELVAGLFQDPVFGPVVLFGLGGTLTEALADVTLRLAPLSRSEAEKMLDEIRARKLLGAFRGEKAANRRQMVDILLALSRISADRPDISEIDINPLIISPEGVPCAVDALVISDRGRTRASGLPPVPPESIGPLFYPRSVAFIGASGQLGKWGHMLVVNTLSGDYKGRVYLVNPKGGSIAGQPAYRSVAEISDEIDLAVVTIPAAKVLELIPQFEAKGIRNMLLISSGFGETGESGKQLENDLVREARRAGVLVLGPNTMGICNPHVNFYCMGSPVRPLAGSTAVVAQSGNMGVQLLAFADRQGIGIRGFCGSGNEAMMTIEDYLDAFEVDSVTRTVILYIESVKNGPRFFESARRVGRRKPVVVLKGGRSQAGHRAAASHTGSMSSDTRVFEAACRQAGIVSVEKPMDLLDLAAAFSSLPLPGGNRAAIMTLGGGWGVVTADLCAEFGLEVPALAPQLIERIDALLPPYWSRANPVDLVGENDPAIPMTVIEELLRWEACDGVINLGIIGRRHFVERFVQSALSVDPGLSKDFASAITGRLQDFENQYIEHVVRLMEKYNKPVFGVSLITELNDQTVYRVKNSPFKGLFFQTPERAVKAFARMCEYRRFLER